MVEDNEELIENWWFKHYAKDKKTDLFRYLCVNNIRGKIFAIYIKMMKDYAI